LMTDIPRERGKFGLKSIDHILARYQFKAHLLLFYGDESSKDRVYRLFERLQSENKIGMSVMTQSDETVMIDLNECEYRQEVEFFVEYLLRNNKEMLKGKDLLIMIGKMTDDRSSIKTQFHKQQKKHSKRLKQFLDDRFDSSCVEKINGNIVKINRNDIDNLLDKKL